VPKQYGAWAILAVPLLLGVAASRPSPWHLVLAVAAGSAYLASVAALEWTRSRRRASLRPAAVFGAVFVASGSPLLVVEPRLLAVGAIVTATAAATLALSLAGRGKSVVVSLVEVAQALALVPAAALLAGSTLGPPVADAALAAGLYLVGSVLMVRSLIRERGNRVFAAASLVFHAAAAVAAWQLLGWPYGVFGVALLARAAGLLVAQGRWRTGSDGSRRLRPVHIGIVEIVASLALVTLGFAVGFRSASGG
jgi:hypothetical protein